MKTPKPVKFINITPNTEGFSDIPGNRCPCCYTKPASYSPAGQKAFEYYVFEVKGISNLTINTATCCHMCGRYFVRYDGVVYELEASPNLHRQ